MILNYSRKISCKLKSELKRREYLTYVRCERNQGICFSREAAKVSYRRVVAKFLTCIRLSLTRRTWRCDASLAIIHKMAELYRSPSVFQQNYNREWELLPLDVSKNLKARRQRWNHKRVEAWSFFRNANTIPRNVSLRPPPPSPLPPPPPPPPSSPVPSSPLSPSPPPLPHPSLLLLSLYYSHRNYVWIDDFYSSDLFLHAHLSGKIREVKVVLLLLCILPNSSFKMYILWWN